jgi:hypothetical protein
MLVQERLAVPFSLVSGTDNPVTNAKVRQAADKWLFNVGSGRELGVEVNLVGVHRQGVNQTLSVFGNGATDPATEHVAWLKVPE